MTNLEVLVMEVKAGELPREYDTEEKEVSLCGTLFSMRSTPNRSSCFLLCAHHLLHPHASSGCRLSWFFFFGGGGVAYRILTPGSKSRTPALEVWSSNHWTARQFPNSLSLLRHFSILPFCCTTAFHYITNKMPRNRMRPTLVASTAIGTNPIKHQDIPRKDRWLSPKVLYWALQFTQGIDSDTSRSLRA